jgi:membrane protease YdiL (CAAX protease family)
MKKNFFILWFAGLVGGVAVLPYAFTLQHEIIAKVDQPLSFIVLVSIIQTAILLAVAVFFGLKLSKRLGIPTLALFDPNSPTKDKLSNTILLAVSAGIATGILIMLGDIFFGLFIPQLTIANAGVAIWKTLLASLYGGIVEELLLRLFLMLLIVFILAKLFKSEKPTDNGMIMWSAIIISAVIFGLGHLPITASLATITTIVVLRAIVLNGIGGLVFGWLFWKKGLEVAMIAHFTADIVLLSILPLLF